MWALETLPIVQRKAAACAQTSGTGLFRALGCWPEPRTCRAEVVLLALGGWAGFAGQSVFHSDPRGVSRRHKWKPPKA